MTESPDAAATVPADRQITHEVLGTFVREVTVFGNGEELDSPHFSATCGMDGRELEMLLETEDPDEARSMLPRLMHVIDWFGDFRDHAIEAIVRTFSTEPPTDADYADAQEDLAADTIVVEGDGQVILHFSDLCGEHFMDGYWPAVRFDVEDHVADVTVEA